jgi:hypothetical protein
MVIDGPLWFFGAVIVCGAHVLYLRSWRREQRQYRAWWRNYDAEAQRRHDEFLRAIGHANGALEWNLDGIRERGQA